MAALSSVSCTKPCANALAQSIAPAFVSPITPCLAATYGAIAGSATRPAIKAV